jgi:glucokinase
MQEFWALGIEIGGTKLQLGIGDGQGSLRALERVDVDPSGGAAGILEQIKAAYPRVLAKANLDRQQVIVAGIGFGGPVNTADGRTVRSFQVAGWEDFPLVKWTAEHLGARRVVLENDSDSAGVAEARFGAGVGYSPLLYVNVGSGIGGALVVNQQLYRGSAQGAVEVGHLHVPDPTAKGPRMVELEHVASGWAIASAAQDLARQKLGEGKDDWLALIKSGRRPDRLTAVDVCQAALAGDPDACTIFERSATAIAFALTQAITLVAPRRIVLGGGVSLSGESLWFDPIRQMVDRSVFAPFRGHFDIVPAALGEEVVVHGALALAREAMMGSP